MKKQHLELKAYKMLSELQSQLIAGMLHRVRNKVEYQKVEPERIYEDLEHIANPDKWDYCELQSKADTKLMDALEYLLNDELDELRKTRGWKPIER